MPLPVPTCNSIARITDYMFLCGEKAITRDKLEILGITDVISCTSEAPKRNLRKIKCTHVKMSDYPFSCLDVHFDTVADMINRIHLHGGKVVVHCVAGVSRSATLCIAYLMKHQNKTLLEAHKLVLNERPIIRPNPGFWKQLIVYEKKLFGKNTVRMINFSYGSVPNIYMSYNKFI